MPLERSVNICQSFVCHNKFKKFSFYPVDAIGENLDDQNGKVSSTNIFVYIISFGSYSSCIATKTTSKTTYRIKISSQLLIR